MSHALPRRYFSISPAVIFRPPARRWAPAALDGLGSIAPTADGGNDHYLLALQERVLLGEAVARIRAAGYELLGCRDERSEVEMAFLSLTRGADA